MANEAPTILFENLLQVSSEGRGDGTIYAWGTAATPFVSAKTFDLTTVNIMTDLGADADDLFNGYVLKFTVSGRSYLLTDWVAATDLGTTFETPNVADTGAWTIRRTLFTDDFNVANPVRYGSNGRLYQKWIDKAANNAVSILASLPNLVDDGGFEKNSLTDYWTTRGVAGTGTVAINLTTPILGTYDCKFNQGDQAYVGLEQVGKGPLRKGYTYGAIMKTGGDGGAVTDLRISLEYVAGSATLVPVTFTEINAGDDTGTANIWKPAITDANAWDEIIFVVSEDIDTGAWKLVMDQYDATDVFIDEIYIWEIGPTVSGVDQPDTLIIAGHNMAGGFLGNSTYRRFRCPEDRTGITAGDRFTTVVNLVDVQVDGNSPIYETFTASTSIYPIHILTFDAISGKTWEAAEIWIGKRWTWDRFVSGSWAPHDGEIDVSSVSSLGGIKTISEKYRRRIIGGSIPYIDNDALLEWMTFILHAGAGEPFWYYMVALSDQGTPEELMLMRNASRPKISTSEHRKHSVRFNFEEVL